VDEMKTEYDTKIEFKIKSTKEFSVVAIGWKSRDKWNWNIYASIFESHPLFNDVDNAKNLPFNCGCTFDELITQSPTGDKSSWGDWQKEYKCLKVGSDYAHIYDDYDNHPSPFDGLPDFIERDALELVESLENKLANDSV
jgi:hypothetical protein